MMWAFDGFRCLPFTYTGCGGNPNRFFTHQQCQQTCETKSSTTSLPTTRTTNASPKYIIKTKSACLQPRVFILSVKCTESEILFFFDRLVRLWLVDLASNCPSFTITITRAIAALPKLLVQYHLMILLVAIVSLVACLV